MKLDHPLVRESEVTCPSCPVQIEGTMPVFVLKAVECRNHVRNLIEESS